MSSHDAPPRKKVKNDPTSLQRQQLEYLQANPDKDHTALPSPISKELPPPPDFVNSVQGSSSGAGSGEFHVYKASRRREMERMALMDAKNKEEREALEYKFKRQEQLQQDEAKTEKNRAKREKAKQAKLKAIKAEKERKAAVKAASPTPVESTKEEEKS